MGQGYGLPLKCPKCPEKDYFGYLKGSDRKGWESYPCPNCKSILIPARKKPQRGAGG
jgi:hypothetical protein